MKISSTEFNEFLRAYYADRKHQRLGQSFCNKYDIHNPELFYTTDDRIAIDLIVANYVEN